MYMYLIFKPQFSIQAIYNNYNKDYLPFLNLVLFF